MASMDTNASAIAESTISMALSKFPEPPSSIPSTPLRSEFGAISSPSRTTFSVPPLNSPPRHLSVQDAGHSKPSSSRVPGRSHFSKKDSTPFYGPYVRGNLPESSQTPLTHDSDGTSAIDVDAIEERLLPTSFITSLLQENKAQRRLKHNTTGDNMSGISEMTYPPLDQLDSDDTLYSCHSSGGPPDSHMPPSAYPLAQKFSNRISGDSETLHSNQGHMPMIRTASISRGVRVQGTSIVGIAPATLHNLSSANQYSSSLDAHNPDKSLHRRLPSTPEADDDDHKVFNSYSPSPFLHTEPAEPHIKDTAVDLAPTSLLSRISAISLRPWWKVKPLPPVPEISLTTEYTHRKYEESASLPELINRAGALQDLLAKGQNPHHSMTSLFEPSLAPHSVREVVGDKSETASRAVTSPVIHQLAAANASATRRKKRIYFLILVVALTAIGAGVGVFKSHEKQRPLACKGAFTGAACNLGNHFLSLSLITLTGTLDATCVCTSSTICNGLARAVVDLLPIVNQNFLTNISLTSAYNSLWIMQGSPTTSNCASQALLADVGNSNDQHLYPNRTQWAQTALLWNAIQTQDMNATEQLQQFVQKIPWTSLGTTDGPISTTNSEQEFSTTVGGFTFNFASQTATQPSASFVTLGQPTNSQLSRVSSQTQTTLDRMYAFAQGMSFSRTPRPFHSNKSK